VTRKKRLGRGLEALLNSTELQQQSSTALAEPDYESSPSETIANRGTFKDADHDGIPDRVDIPTTTDHSQSTSDVMHLSVYEIEDNPFQPRRVFSEPEIASLAESLKEHDILQPILVRVVDGRYQLISGERRLRAAIKANWQTIPARVRTADDRLVSELAIVENLQRKDLNAIEKALSFRRYIDEHNCTQEGLAGRLKIDRSTIANFMRLLELPPTIQKSIQEEKISAGHARALLPLGDDVLQQEYCDLITREGLSVRAIERLVSERLLDEDGPGPKNALQRSRRNRDRQIESLQQELKLALGTKVKIKQGARERGQIVISFSNSEEFERLRELLLGQIAPDRGSQYVG
jgi:ParB family chromosome partitioning protein